MPYYDGAVPSRQVALVLYVKTSAGWRRYPAAFGKNGRPSQAQAEGARLDAAIAANLKELGYGE